MRGDFVNSLVNVAKIGVAISSRIGIPTARNTTSAFSYNI